MAFKAKITTRHYWPTREPKPNLAHLMILEACMKFNRIKENNFDAEYLQKNNFGSFLLFLGLYWDGEEKTYAWFSIVALFILSLLGVTTALVLNEWYKYFYNSIQVLDKDGFYGLVAIFLAIVAFSVCRAVAISYVLDLLAVRWRKWLTNYYLNAWVVEASSYGNIEKLIDNPDQRISEDINKFTYETLDLGCGLIYTALSVISFSVVLIRVSGDLSVAGFVVPFYMLWAALLYAVVGTYISQRIGFRLVSLSGLQQRSEADFRYCLVKFRDHSDMNLSSGRLSRKSVMLNKLDLALENMRLTIIVKMRLSFFTESYSQLSLIVSSVLAVPRFFSGTITFGDLMQVNSAFGNLCSNLSWFINAYQRLADWKATADRLISLHRVLAMSTTMSSSACKAEIYLPDLNN